MSICAAGKKGYNFLDLKEYLFQNYFILKMSIVIFTMLIFN